MTIITKTSDKKKLLPIPSAPLAVSEIKNSLEKFSFFRPPSSILRRKRIEQTITKKNPLWLNFLADDFWWGGNEQSYELHFSPSAKSLVFCTFEIILCFCFTKKRDENSSEHKRWWLRMIMMREISLLNFDIACVT